MVQMLNIEELKDIYLISNTASFLFNEFAKEESIQQLVIKNQTSELISDFVQLSNKSIDDINDLVTAYALYIAIVLKNDDESYDFFNTVGKIEFEWFPEIRSLFLSQMRPTQYFSFSVGNLNNSKKQFSCKNEQVINSIDF